MNVRRPYWYVAASEPSRACTGERRLWEALVHDAIETVRTYPVGSWPWRHDWAWLHGAPAPLPFAEICDGLGLDAEAVVAALPIVHGIPPPIRRQPWRNRRRLNMPDRVCLECGATFSPYLPHQLYCIPRHRHTAQCRRARQRRARA
jgi:hypothetical protein